MIILVVVFAAVGFFAGMQYQKSQSTTGGTNQYGQFQGGGRRNGGQGQFNGGRVIGKVISSDNASLTVQLQDGSSKLIILSGTTTYSKSAQAARSDVKVGDEVAVFGATNSDGSITAQNVQLNPQMRGPKP